MAREKEVNVIVDAKNKSKRSFIEVKRDLRDLDRETRRGTSSFKSNFAKMDKAVLGFSNRLKFMDKIAKRTFQGTAAATSIYVATTLRDFSQLENGISKVNTLYDQTRQSQDKMVKDSLQMYKLLPTDFGNITQGIYDSISAGVDSKYAGITSRKFGQASVAGMTELPVVTKAAMGTMNAFGKEIKDLNHILDIQFMTINKGIVEYDQLASSLGTGVLKSADSAGVSMEELYAAIAGITKNAIPANVATTSLIQLFNKFTDTKALKEFKDFGVEIQDGEKNTRSLVEIFKDLNEQFEKKGFTKEQRAGYLKELLGSDEAVRALQPLLGGLKDFQNILGQMENSSGAMSDAFEDRLDNINTQAKLMWNNFKAYGVEQVLTLKPFFDALMGPTLEKQKLTFQKMDLEDYMQFEKDPRKRKMARMEIQDIQKQIDQIDLTPVEQFREALNESTDKLREINPLLADIIDTVGGFLINFVGDEGEGWRKGAKYTGIGLGTIYGTKKAVDAYRWFKPIFNSGKSRKSLSPADTLAKTLQTMSVNAGVVNVYGRQNGLPSGNSNKPVILDKNGKPINSPKPTGTRPLKTTPTTTTKPMSPKSLLNKLPKGITGYLAEAGILALGVATLFNEGKKNRELEKKRQRLDKGSYVLDSGMINSKDIEDIRKVQSFIEAPKTKKEGSNFLGFSSSNLMQQMDKVNSQVNLKNDIKVEPPKLDVKVYVDGKQIPARFDYNSMRDVIRLDIERHLYKQSIRHGK